MDCHNLWYFGSTRLLAVFAPCAAVGGVGNWGLGFISAIGLGIASLMMIIAFPGLKAGKMAGWNMLLASELISIVSSVIGASVGTIIGAAIGLYLLFQIKPKYK